MNAVTYPEPTGSELLIKRDMDTHRVELKKIRPVPDVKISQPGDVIMFVREMEDYDREYFKVIYLDNKNRVLGVENISEGTINAALVHPREAVKGAVLANAAGVVLVHNHPSGVPQPSREDEVIIGRLQVAFRMMGIDVTDALIIGKEGYYSFKEEDKLIAKPSGGLQVMEQKDDKCSIAMRAAMQTISDYCFEETEVEIDGVKIKVIPPESVLQVREKEDLTHEQRVKAIQESAWGQGEATGLCTKLFGVSPGEEEYARCIERVSRKLAEGMVGK